MYTSHNFVTWIFAPKENALEILNELTRLMTKDHNEFETTNQIKDQTNDFFKISQSTPHKDPCNETKKKIRGRTTNLESQNLCRNES